MRGIAALSGPKPSTWPQNSRQRIDPPWHLPPSLLPSSGLSGSQLDATQTGGVSSCPAFSSPRQVYADVTWLKNLPCLSHIMSAGYDHSTGR